MKIVVIGAGVIGVTSAWYLTKDGHEVTVLEARENVALETSFGNAGGVCPGFAGPWAAPGMPLKGAVWMFRKSAPLKIRPRASLAQWSWLARFVANCTAARYARNKAEMQRVAHYSKACLVALREETGIEYDHGTGGVLQIFQTAEEAAGGERAAAVLKRMDVPHRLLTPEAVREIEPGLARSEVALSGGLQLTTDETGDCHLFTQALAALVEQAGGRFRFNAKVTGFRKTAGRLVAAQLASGEEIGADAFVLATGPWTDLFKPLGVRMPIYPVKGYSLTAEITDADAAPLSSVMDEHSKVMITRLGNRLRAAGVAELAGFDRSMPPPVLDALKARVAALFPGAARYDEAQLWHGFRPMTPSGPSSVQRVAYENLFLNMGHGSNGWTQAAGTARMLADLVTGKAGSTTG